MAFKRMERFAGSIPQGFIDSNIKVCPLCGTTNPHWSIDQKIQMKLEGNLYLFKCEQCDGILSSPISDVTGVNNTLLTTPGLLKKLSGKKNNEIYIRIYDVGNSGKNDLAETECTLSEINQMAAEISNEKSEKKFY